MRLVEIAKLSRNPSRGPAAPHQCQRRMHAHMARVFTHSEAEFIMKAARQMPLCKTRVARHFVERELLCDIRVDELTCSLDGAVTSDLFATWFRIDALDCATIIWPPLSKTVRGRLAQ